MPILRTALPFALICSACAATPADTTAGTTAGSTGDDTTGDPTTGAPAPTVAELAACDEVDLEPLFFMARRSTPTPAHRSPRCPCRTSSRPRPAGTRPSS